MDLTAAIITTLISLLTIIGIVGKFISTQTALEVQLSQIQKDITEIKLQLNKRDSELRCLSDRVIKLEEHNKK
jgi:hypothetical protein